MRIPRIYLPASLDSDHLIELDERAFQHTVRVLRMKAGAELQVFDGKGNEFSACLETVSKREASIRLLEKLERQAESPLQLHLGLGISKGERMDYAMQKAVELGVTEISPLFTDHCVVNLDEKRMQKRLAHWQGVIISACEQCGRNLVPELHPPLSLQKWFSQLQQRCIVFEPQAEKSLQQLEAEQDIAVLIGPEGGLSDKEISLAASLNNIETVRFGPRILRTETAAVAALTALQVLWGDL